MNRYIRGYLILAKLECLCFSCHMYQQNCLGLGQMLIFYSNIYRTKLHLLKVLKAENIEFSI